ncbi:MAG: hypothetical protein ACRYGB_07615 [Janthinobacterium lividum]
MKNLIKISILSLAIAGFSFSAKAQTTDSTRTARTHTAAVSDVRTSKAIRLSIGPDAGIPIGTLGNTHNWNLGGSIQADFPVATGLDVTVNAGYNNIFGKNNAPDISLIPVKAGLKYFVASNFYVQGEAGASILANKNKIAADKSASFVYAPQIGYLFPVGGKNYIDLGVRFESNTKFYNAGNSNNFFGLRVAYAFDTK